jgi:acetyl esterase
MFDQKVHFKAWLLVLFAFAAMAVQVFPAATQPARQQGQREKYTFEQVANRYDANKDGKVTKEEMGGRADMLDSMDTNKDGVLTAEDFANQKGAESASDAASSRGQRTRRSKTDTAGSRSRAEDSDREKAVLGNERKKRIPDDLRDKLNIMLDVPYGTVDPELQSVDAYIVKSDKPTPVLMEVHPGAFCRGSKSSEFFFRNDGLWMKALRNGISVVSINYRLAPKHTFTAETQDMARAVQFVRSKAKEWNIDPERIASSGGSAGAHLSMWVGFHDDMANAKSDDPIEHYSTRLQCIVEWRGPADFSRLIGEDGLSPMLQRVLPQFLGIPPEQYGKTEESKEKFKAVSPLTYLTPDDPPTLLAYAGGTVDPNAEAPHYINDPHSFWWGIVLNKAMNEKHVPHELVVGKLAEKVDVEINFLKKYLLGASTSQPAAPVSK